MPSVPRIRLCQQSPKLLARCALQSGDFSCFMAPGGALEMALREGEEGGVVAYFSRKARSFFKGPCSAKKTGFC